MVDRRQVTKPQEFLQAKKVLKTHYSTAADKSILKRILLSLHCADSVVKGWLSNNC